MDAQRQIYNNFLSLNAHKARTTSVPTAHVMFYQHGKPMTPLQPLIAMSVNDILQELDKEADLVRWLLNQLATYKCSTQRIVALIFDRQTVLSDVLR